VGVRVYEEDEVYVYVYASVCTNATVWRKVGGGERRW
jgi:hypothetical protein